MCIHERDDVSIRFIFLVVVNFTTSVFFLHSIEKSSFLTRIFCL